MPPEANKPLTNNLQKLASSPVKMHRNGSEQASSSFPIAEISKLENETFVTQRGGKLVNDQPAPELPKAFESQRTLQSTLLLQKKKEMQQVQAQLEKKRIEFTKRMEECREKQEELKFKQKQIKDRVLKFEKFLKENDAKRQRANVKAQTERKTRESKEMEYGGLLKQLHEEQSKSEKIGELIRKHKIYEDFLQSVVDNLPSDYLDINEPHINDVLMRHKTLLETNEDLIKTVQQFQDAIEDEQANLANHIKEKNDLILVYNSSLGTGQKKLEKLKQDVAYLEQRIEERDNSGKERMRILGEAKLAINNLYNRISGNREETPHADAEKEQTSIQPKAANTAEIQEGDTNLKSNALEKTIAGKLRAIQDRIVDLQLVALKAEQLVAKEREKKLA